MKPGLFALPMKAAQSGCFWSGSGARSLAGERGGNGVWRAFCGTLAAFGLLPGHPGRGSTSVNRRTDRFSNPRCWASRTGMIRKKSPALATIPACPPGRRLFCMDDPVVPGLMTGLHHRLGLPCSLREPMNLGLLPARTCAGSAALFVRSTPMGRCPGLACDGPLGLSFQSFRDTLSGGFANLLSRGVPRESCSDGSAGLVTAPARKGSHSGDAPRSQPSIFTNSRSSHTAA